MYPSAPATLKEVVTEVRWRGSRLRTARAGAEPVAAAGAGTDVAEVDPPDSGWPTLQLSRYTASALMPIFQALKWISSISSTVADSGMLTVLEIAPEMNGWTAAIIRTSPSGEIARSPTAQSNTSYCS